MYTAANIALPVTHVFWVGKYKEVEAQCKAHGVTQCGTIEEMIKNFRKHYKLDHVEATFKARTIPLSAWLKQEPQEKKVNN